MLRAALLGIYALSLAAMAFWVLLWPVLAGFAGDASGMRSGHLATLAVYLGAIAILCTFRLRGGGGG